MKAKREVPFSVLSSGYFEVAPVPGCPRLKSPSSRPTAEEICGVTPPSSGKSSKVQHHRPCLASHTSEV